MDISLLIFTSPLDTTFFFFCVTLVTATGLLSVEVVSMNLSFHNYDTILLCSIPLQGKIFYKISCAKSLKIKSKVQSFAASLRQSKIKQLFPQLKYLFIPTDTY